MKKSEQYHNAIKAVIRYEGVDSDSKIEIIETLIDAKSLEKFREEQEEKK